MDDNSDQRSLGNGQCELEIEVETPDGLRVIPAGSSSSPVILTKLLSDAELPLNTRCGQRSLCEGCVIDLLRGRLRDLSGRPIEAQEAPIKLRACQHTLSPGSSATIRVPMRSLLATRPQVLSSFKINIPRAHDPLWQRLTLPRLHLHHTDPDGFAAIVAQNHDGQWPVRPIDPWPLPQEIEDEPTAVLTFAGDHWLVRPSSESDPSRPLGAAIDIGTTTVVVMVVELGRGRVLGRASDTNAQVSFGDNVLTRIERCMGDSAAVTQLQEAVIEQTLRPLLEKALAQAEASPEELVCLTVAGNTTMLHLLAGADPSPLGTKPFEPVFLEHRTICARELGLMPQAASVAVEGGSAIACPPHEARVHLLPGASAYVGADVMAGVLSSGLAYDEGSSMLVDVGTNGEIIARLGDRLVGCATAAGPAFEGAGLLWGMRAGHGAIAHLRLEDEPLTIHCECIGDGLPVGLCGSAYIDLLGEGRRIRLINEYGRIDVARAQAADLYADAGCNGAALHVARTSAGEDILVTEADIATIIQAKAAIAAGITTLLNNLDMSFADVQRVYLAGGFGMHVDTDNAISSGLLPGFKREQIQLVGNTSLAGAYLTLLDAGALSELMNLHQRIEIIELNLDPEFESTFIEHLSLP